MHVNRAPAPDEPDCNCLAIRKAARQLTQLYDTELADTGLRITQYTLLSRLNRVGPMSMQALAEQLVMDRTTLSHNLKPLERDGFVEQTVSLEDRRSRLLGLTPAGAKKLASVRGSWKRAQNRFHAQFGEAEAASLRRLLSDVVTAAR